MPARGPIWYDAGCWAAKRTAEAIRQRVGSAINVWPQDEDGITLISKLVAVQQVGVRYKHAFMRISHNLMTLPLGVEKVE